ncbi:SRPBCC family protein [Streptomycetaceae bacterium NBC_01309]
MPTLSVTTVINRPADQVWNAIRDFRDPSVWYPLPLADRTGGAEPDIRHVHAPGGATLRERLVEHDDPDCRYTYEILDLDRHPCGLRFDGPCLATLRVESIIGGTMARVVWSARYAWALPQDESDGGHEQIRRLGRDLFRPALRALRRKMS